MIGRGGARADSRLHERQAQAIRVVHLTVVPERTARDTGRVEARIPIETLGPRDHATGRQMLRRIGYVVPVERHEVVDRQRRMQRGPTPHRMPVGGDEKRQRVHQVGRDAAEGATFSNELPHLLEIALLDRAQSAVNRLVAVERRARAEIAPIDQGDREPALRGLPGNRRAVDAGAHDQQIERLAVHA